MYIRLQPWHCNSGASVQSQKPYSIDGACTQTASRLPPQVPFNRLVHQEQKRVRAKLAAMIKPVAGLCQCATPDTGSVKTEPIGNPHDRRLEFLKTYKMMRDRDVCPARAKDAIKLRKFAEEMYRKNVLSRFTHKLPGVGPSKSKLAALKAMDVDSLIRDIRNGKIDSDRTTLTDVAQHHLIASLNFDRPNYMKGVQSMARWEGVHSAVGRGITFASSLATFGIVPVIYALGTATVAGVAKAIKLAGHNLPTAVVNPFATGIIRINTDIRKSCDNSGISKIAKNIESARTLSAIRNNIQAKNAVLQNLLKERANSENFFCHSKQGAILERTYNARLTDAFIQAYEAQHEYKVRLGSTKSYTWSKGYGMAVNGIGSTAQVIGLAFPPAIPASLALQGLCIPLQWGAGYLDMHTGQAYNFRANLKYADLLTEAGKHLPIDQLSNEHIDQARLRTLFQSFQSQKMELIREIYTHELGELHFSADRLEAGLQSRTGVTMCKASAPDLHIRMRIKEIRQRIAEKETQARQFESLELLAWRKLPPDSTIGRCLDDQSFLVQRGQQARRQKPGEMTAQIWQRYKQIYGDGILSTGLLVPGIDATMNFDHLNGSQSSPEATTAIHTANTIGAVTAATTFTAATGIVRADKANDKRDLAKMVARPHPQVTVDFMRRRWAVSLDDQGKNIDLSHTSGFDRSLHSRAERIWRFVKIVPHGFFTSERALVNVLRARHARRCIKHSMQDALAVLQTQQTSSTGWHAEKLTCAALKTKFLAAQDRSRQLQIRVETDNATSDNHFVTEK